MTALFGSRIATTRLALAVEMLLDHRDLVVQDADDIRRWALSTDSLASSRERN